MYKDIITYELADGKEESELLKVAEEILDNWMKNLSGFVSWEINRNSENSYTDVVCWATKEDADKATAEMANIPNATAWYACYKEGSIKSVNLKRLVVFE